MFRFNVSLQEAIFRYNKFDTDMTNQAYNRWKRRYINQSEDKVRKKVIGIKDLKPGIKLIKCYDGVIRERLEVVGLPYFKSVAGHPCMWIKARDLNFRSQYIVGEHSLADMGIIPYLTTGEWNTTNETFFMHEICEKCGQEIKSGECK